MNNKIITAIVAADIHNNESCFKKLLPIINEADYFFFLGDGYGIVKSAFRQIKAKTEFVSGNCDFASGLKSETIIQVGNCKLFLTHGHRYGVKSSYDEIAFAAKSNACEYACFAHTHIPYINFYRGVTLLNSGTLSGARTGMKTYLKLIGDGTMFSCSIEDLE